MISLKFTYYQKAISVAHLAHQVKRPGILNQSRMRLSSNAHPLANAHWQETQIMHKGTYLPHVPQPNSKYY